MLALVSAAFSPVNLPYTVLLMLILLYWLIVALGVLGTDLFDFDLDLDMEADPSLMQGFLAFMNLAELPVMLVLSAFVFSLWTCSIVYTHYLIGNSVALALVLAIPNVVGSLILTKWITGPFVSLYRRLGYDPAAEIKAVGSLCKLLDDAEDRRYAQAEVKTEGAPLLLNVQTRSGVVLMKGSTALVVEKRTDKDVFIVEPFKDWES